MTPAADSPAGRLHASAPGKETRAMQTATRRLAAASIAAAALAAPWTPPAAQGGRPAAADPPSLVAELRSRGAVVSPIGGTASLAGYLVEPRGGAPYSLYVTADGHAVAGLLYDPRGDLLTARQAARPPAPPGAPRAGAPEAPSRRGPMAALREAAPAPRAPPPGPRTAEYGDGDPGPPPPLHPALRPQRHADVPHAQARLSTHNFRIGGGGHEVLVWADPTCLHSTRAVGRLAREAAKGRFGLTVVPVGLLSSRAAESAAGILASPSPARAWFGLDPHGPVTPEAVQSLDWNNLLFEAWPGGSVPQIAWKDGDGWLRHVVGDITDIDAFLRSLVPTRRESGE